MRRWCMARSWLATRPPRRRHRPIASDFGLPSGAACTDILHFLREISSSRVTCDAESCNHIVASSSGHVWQLTDRLACRRARRAASARDASFRQDWVPVKYISPASDRRMLHAISPRMPRSLIAKLSAECSGHA